MLSRRKPDDVIEVDIGVGEPDVTNEEMKQTGLMASNLYIAHGEQKYRIIERVNYNKPKSWNLRQPQCPPDKETQSKMHFDIME